jgi:hypothetical protein
MWFEIVPAASENKRIEYKAISAYEYLQHALAYRRVDPTRRNLLTTFHFRRDQQPVHRSSASDIRIKRRSGGWTTEDVLKTLSEIASDSHREEHYCLHLPAGLQDIKQFLRRGLLVSALAKAGHPISSVVCTAFLGVFDPLPVTSCPLLSAMSGRYK